MIYLAEHAHRRPPRSALMAHAPRCQGVALDPAVIRPELSTLSTVDRADINSILEAIRLLVGAVNANTRQIQALEAKTPGAPEVLSVRDVEVIYKGQLSKSKLYELSNPDRPGGVVLSRVERRGGGTGFLRSEIERWLRGLPTKGGAF